MSTAPRLFVAWLLVVSASVFIALPAAAQVSANLPVTCSVANPSNCVQATPVTNPDGTNIGGGGSYNGPVAAQLPATLGAKTGANSLSVVPNTDTPFPASQSGTWNITNISGTISLPTGAATSALQTTGNASLSTIAGSVGTTASAVPAGTQLGGGRTTAGNLVSNCVATTGVQCAPIAGTANRVITKTSVSVNTNTTICPTATAPVTTEIQVTSGAVGIGLNGQTLTAAVLGTNATTDPDLVMPTALTLYTMPVASTNAITAYTGTAQVIVCIQTIRQ